MTAQQYTPVHEESWLLLPWLANGRLAGAQRALVEEHLRECAACAEEAELQRHMCAALTEPERVTYAPGPSFRKLMERIDGQAPAPTRPSRPFRAPAPRARISPPPGGRPDLPGRRASCSPSGWARCW